MATVTAYAAAIVAFGYALVSLYWALGGHALVSTVGGYAEQVARRGGALPVLIALAATLAKVAGGLLPLALVRPWGRLVRRGWLLAGSAVASALLTVYGGLNVLLGTLVLSGVIHPAGSVDRTALRWHVGVWDLWFLVWGILLAVATIAYWRRTAWRAYAEGVPRYNSGATMGAIARFFEPFHKRRVVSLVRDRGTDSPLDEEIKQEAAAEVERVEQDDKYFAPETPADRDDLLSPIFQISGRGIDVARGYASSRTRTIAQGFTVLIRYLRV